MTFRQKIIEEFSSGEFNKIGEKALAKRLGLMSFNDKKILKETLLSLEKEGVLIFDGGLYSIFDEKNYIKGKIHTFERGFAFLTPTDGSPDMFIPPNARNGAYQNDIVLAKKTFEADDESDEAEVIKIISRGTEYIAGVFHTHGSFCFVIPDDKNFAHRVLIPKGKSMSAADGKQVVCKITMYAQDGDPRGEVTDICGDPNDVLAREEAILVTSDVNVEFPARVLDDADKIPLNVTAKAAAGREDYRDLLTVTIDGDTAKDFDDAISVEETDDGFVLYVHIADVSEYVKSGSSIDREAYARGTSIYLPDRVIPMLPERLCNGICSLIPNEERLTLTVRLVYDKQGNLIDKSFYKSIIKSFKRLTYKKVQAALDGEKEQIEEYKEIMPMLLAAKRLKDLLLKKRKENGSVDLDVEECEVRAGEDGIIVEKRESIESERIIEQFMIAANVAVAEFAFYADMPLVYRVHEKPSPEKIQTFTDFLNVIGIENAKYKFKYPKDYQCILEKINGNELFPIVNNVMLRSMQKAVYLSENKGHFGLNEKCYCHFTSPIRRYPDLIVHRILKGIIEGRAGAIVDEYTPKIAEIAANCTECERKSDLVSRAVDDAYVCKFMRSFIGDYFEVIVSGVTANGLYVRLENSVEGFVPVERLPRGKYAFFDKGYALLSGKRKFTLGDRLIVKLVSTDIAAGKIYFDYLGKVDKPGGDAGHKHGDAGHKHGETQN